MGWTVIYGPYSGSGTTLAKALTHLAAQVMLKGTRVELTTVVANCNLARGVVARHLLRLIRESNVGQ